MSFGEWTFEGGAKGRSRVATDGGGRYTARYFLIPIKEAYALKTGGTAKKRYSPRAQFSLRSGFYFTIKE